MEQAQRHREGSVRIRSDDERVRGPLVTRADDEAACAAPGGALAVRGAREEREVVGARVLERGDGAKLKARVPHHAAGDSLGDLRDREGHQPPADYFFALLASRSFTRSSLMSIESTA